MKIVDANIYSGESKLSRTFVPLVLENPSVNSNPVVLREVLKKQRGFQK
jgi:hypothetical protein